MDQEASIRKRRLRFWTGRALFGNSAANFWICSTDASIGSLWTVQVSPSEQGHASSFDDRSTFQDSGISCFPKQDERIQLNFWPRQEGWQSNVFRKVLKSERHRSSHQEYSWQSNISVNAGTV